MNSRKLFWRPGDAEKKANTLHEMVNQAGAWWGRNTREAAKKKRHLGVNAQKYADAREISPPNEAMQAVPFEHAQMSKLWYVESPKRLSEGCTQLRARQTLQLTPGETEKWGEVQRGKQRSPRQGRGWALQVGSRVMKHLRSAKRWKRTIRAAAFRILATAPHFVPISAEQWGDKFAVQTPGRERFQFCMRKYSP